VGGDSVTSRLEEGLKAATHGILVVSPFSVARAWVQEEYQVMLRQAVGNPTRRLIPVLYKDAELPPFLANREWVDFRTATTGPPYDQALDKLVRSLQGRPAQDRPDRGGPTEWPQPPTGQGFRPAGPTIEAVKHMCWVWRRAPGPEATAPDRPDQVLAEAGRRLAQDFLAGGRQDPRRGGGSRNGTSLCQNVPDGPKTTPS